MINDLLKGIKHFFTVRFKPKERTEMGKVVKQLGLKDTSEQEWLILTPKDKLPKPAKEAFPRYGTCA